MPKVKWAAGLSEEAIDNVETNQYTPYDGPTPPRGVYGFRVKGIKKSKSSNNNDQLQVRLELDPRGRTEHKKYAGFFMMDFIPVLEQTAWRLRPFLDALGVTARDFIRGTVVDEDGQVTKIGKLVIDNILVVGNIRPSKNNSDYFDISYSPKRDDPAPDEDADDDEDDDGDAPF